MIDELSESSIAAAKVRLAGFAEQVEFEPITAIPKIAPGLIFSNELLDAFPIHRVTVRDGQLSEFYVKVGPTGDFQWTVGPLSTLRISEYLDFVERESAKDRLRRLTLE